MATGDFAPKKGMNPILQIVLVFFAAFAGALLANFLTKSVMVDTTGKFIAELKPRLNTPKPQNS